MTFTKSILGLKPLLPLLNCGKIKSLTLSSSMSPRIIRFLFAKQKSLIPGAFSIYLSLNNFSLKIMQNASLVYLSLKTFLKFYNDYKPDILCQTKTLRKVKSQ